MYESIVMAAQTSSLQEVQEETPSLNGTIIVDTSHLITEDDEPVDNVFSSHQQRLLVEPLYVNVSVWNPKNRPFVADANVGVFMAARNPAIVPDAFLSMDIDFPLTDEAGNPVKPDFTKLRSYFVWEFGKVPDVVVEIVSNRKGGEMRHKMQEYAKMHVPYYAVFDPFLELKGEVFQIYRLERFAYVTHGDFWMEEIGVGLRLWDGVYETYSGTWLRWCDERGNVFPTGKEGVAAERQQTEKERERAEKERERADRLAAKLRELGINPDDVA